MQVEKQEYAGCQALYVGTPGRDLRASGRASYVAVFGNKLTLSCKKTNRPVYLILGSHLFKLS